MLATRMRIAAASNFVQVEQPAYEVDEDAGTVTVTVVKKGSGACSVNYALNDGTATAGTDYTDDSGTLNWSAGDTDPKTVNVAITDRTGGQGQRDFTFDLSNPSFCTIGDAQATVTIDDVFHLSDAVAAYDLQDAGSLWQNTAGTTAAGTGDPLGRIDDQSGNGNHLLQGTTAAKPTLQNDGANNYAYTDGTDDVMSATVTIPHPVVIATAMRRIGGTFFFGRQVGGGTYLLFSLNRAEHRGSGGSFVISGTPLGQNAVLRSSAPASDFFEFWVDGVSQGTNSGDVVDDFSSGGGIILGGRVFGGSLGPGEMRFYRGVVMDRALTAGEAASLDQWLADGSGVTL